MTKFCERIADAFRAENQRRALAGEPRLTKTMLWKTAGTSSGSVTHWFSGSNGADLLACHKIAPLLRVSTFWLFDGTGDRATSSETPATPVAEHTDPTAAALAELDRLHPAKAALFRAEIAMALHEALEKQAAAPPKIQQSA